MTIPKYVQTQRAVVDLIATNRLGVGSLLPTEPELAKRFGVSLITLRRAMGKLEELQVVRRAQGRGTFVAAGSQELKKAGTIAFVNIFEGPLAIPTFGPSLMNLDNSLARRGYDLRLVAAGREPSHDVTRLLVDVDGVLVSGWITQEWLQLLASLNMPLVIVGTVAGDTYGMPSVVYDWQGMATMLADNLLNRGARRLGLIAGGSDYAPSAEMRTGLEVAMQARGLSVDPDCILFPDHHRKAPEIVDYLNRCGESLDGLLVEVGWSADVLAWLLSRSCRPHLGVLAVSPVFRQQYEAITEAHFPDDIYEASIQLLFAMTEPTDGAPASIRLQPALVGGKKKASS